MQLFNIFPTTVYVGEVTDHQTHKEEFYKVYHKFDYEDSDANSTVSENTGRPFIHLEAVSYTHLTLPTNREV